MDRLQADPPFSLVKTMSTKLKRFDVQFEVGQIRATPAALESIDPDDFFNCLVRHMAGDWGDVCEEDWKANDEAVDCYARILSSYHDRRNVKFWIITEADRSATTILLPQDY